MMSQCSLAILDYGAGNLLSVENALNYLGVNNYIAKVPKDLMNCSGVIIPGVGAFDDAMSNLESRGFVSALNEIVFERPILGICLGMQLFCNGSEEGVRSGLGWIDTQVKSLGKHNPNLKVPNMGWNEVNHNSTQLFEGIESGTDFYFVHSFAVEEFNGDAQLSMSSHGTEFVSAIEYKNVFAVQFHPEKSQDHGLHLLNNFAKVCHG